LFIESIALEVCPKPAKFRGSFVKHSHEKEDKFLLLLRNPFY
jgi:hypothetical protein